MVLLIVIAHIASADTDMCMGGIQYLENAIEELHPNVKGYDNPNLLSLFDTRGNIKDQWAYFYIDGTNTTNKPAVEVHYRTYYINASSKNKILIKKLDEQIKQLQKIIKIQKTVSRECIKLYGGYNTIRYVGTQRSPQANYPTSMHKYNHKYFYEYGKDKSEWGYPPIYSLVSTDKFEKQVKTFSKFIDEIKSRNESPYDQKVRLSKESKDKLKSDLDKFTQEFESKN